MLHQDNERLLTLLSEYLAFTPAAIGEGDVRALAAGGRMTPDEACLSLLADRLGLNPGDPADARLIREDLPRILRREDPARYEADAYYRAVRPREGRLGAVELGYETLAPMELFIADDFTVDADGRILPPLAWFDRAFTFPAIRENGQVWMTVTPNEINTIRPAVAQSRGRVLTYGLGLGYYAFHCLLRSDVESVTVVEKNPAVIDAFTRWLLPCFPRQQDLHIIQADAFDYARHVMPGAGFDTVFTDLWRDVADGLPLYRRMKALESPGPRYLYWIEKTLQVYMA